MKITRTIQVAMAVVAVALLPAFTAAAQRGGVNGDAYSAETMGEATIQYDAETGSIIVIADEETNAHIQQIIETLDRPVPQVLIKVLFLEVTHSDDLDLGVEGFFQDVTEIDYSDSTESSTFETAFGVAAETRGGFYKLLEEDLNLTIRALSEVGKLEVLSRPSILTRNNQEATITVGQEVPFVRNSRVTSDGQTINTVEYEDIGIILTVTPKISPDRVVELEVVPEISTITGDTVQISESLSAPVFAKRSAETGVVVPDGKTVVIGGLMEDSETATIRKVPLLGDIPGVGALFRRKITQESKTELLIFLTPHVIIGTEELEKRSTLERESTELATEVFTGEELSRYMGDGDEAEAAEPDLEAADSERPRRRGSSGPGKGNRGVLYKKH